MSAASEPRGGEPLAAWTLATFHAVGFVLVLLVLVYRTGALGEILQGLSTVTGLALFLALWATTCATTRRALAGGRWSRAADGGDVGALVRAGARWGAANGLLFLAALAIAQGVTALVARPSLDTLRFVVGLSAFLATFGALVAFGLGGIVGLALAALDVAALAVARRITGYCAPR
ncbi:MAG: hypothetical protein ACRDF0_03705 [Candidatus Limnocylindria bacterium]